MPRRRRGQVIDRDRGWRRIMGRYKQMRGSYVDIGLFAGKFNPEHGTQIVEYAFYNEFGTRRIPERPFMRKTFDENKRKYARLLKDMKQKIEDGSYTVKGALAVVGMEARNDVVQMITREPSPFVPNAPSTVEKKGSSRPLIDTGEMMRAIQFAVYLKGQRVR